VTRLTTFVPSVRPALFRIVPAIVKSEKQIWPSASTVSAAPPTAAEPRAERNRDEPFGLGESTTASAAEKISE